MPRKKTKAKDPYETYLTEKVKRAQKDGPVKLSKYYLTKVFEKIEKCENKTKKKKHPLVEKNNYIGERCLSVCASPSVNATSLHLTRPIQYIRTRNFLTGILRKALLNHNWNHSLRLLELLMDECFASKDLLMYYFRVILILLFNMSVPDDEIHRFLAVTFSLREEDERKEFLKSIVTLSEFGTVKEKKQKLERKQELNIKRNSTNEKNKRFPKCRKKKEQK